MCTSAHWLTRGAHITAMEAPRTIHDFGGFPRELYEFQYPAPGDPALAKEAAALLAPVEVGLVKQPIAEGNHQPLIHYQRFGRPAQLASPTPGHYYLLRAQLQPTPRKCTLFVSRNAATPQQRPFA